MSETSPITESSGADVSAYENIDLSQLNMQPDAEKPGEKKLEFFLVKTILYAKIATAVGIGMLVLSALYGITRYQTQDSWLMNLPLNSREGPLCSWMNHGNQTTLRRDTAFLDYLATEGQQSLIDLDSSGRCLAIDTIQKWLEYQYKFDTAELAKAYEKIIPKKYLGVTIDASPEFDIIAKNAPRNRVNYPDLIGTVSDTIQKFSTTSSVIICDEIRFVELDADLSCVVIATAPVQPRKKALEFMQALEATGSLLVTYPQTLDLAIDPNTQKLTTEFVAKLTYIPARYEAETIENITYDKR